MNRSLAIVMAIIVLGVFGFAGWSYLSSQGSEEDALASLKADSAAGEVLAGFESTRTRDETTHGWFTGAEAAYITCYAVGDAILEEAVVAMATEVTAAGWTEVPGTGASGKFSAYKDRGDGEDKQLTVLSVGSSNLCSAGEVEVTQTY